MTGVILPSFLSMKVNNDVMISCFDSEVKLLVEQKIQLVQSGLRVLSVAFGNC